MADNTLRLGVRQARIDGFRPVPLPPMTENAANITTIDFLDELRWRGLLKDCTDEAGLAEHLGDPGASRRLAYAGFDPTADSLTIGNLVPIMMLVHFARAGHTPVVLMGGGTGLIGDPSGKSAERQLMTDKTVAAHVNAQRPIFENVFRGAGLQPPRIVNNADWLTRMSAIELLRDVGKHFSVNQMMAKESVRERLTNREQGISYTEFSYMILQAYDFLHLFEHERVTIQMGGSDQYGNITAGTDLIRRERGAVVLDAMREIDALGQVSGRLEMKELPDIAGEIRSGLRDISDQAPLGEWSARAYSTLSGLVGHWQTQIPKVNQTLANVLRNAVATFTAIARRLHPHTSDCFGLTAPLVAKADGGKFGKTEEGAIWLSAPKTTAYAMYQFWLNTSDADAVKFLKLFTLLSREEIEAIERAHEAEPHRREAQKILAMEATSLIHGKQQAEAAERAGRALFSGELADLSLDLLEQVFAGVASSEHDRAGLAGEGASLVDVLSETSLAKSKREAREFLGNGSVSVNGVKVTDEARLTEADLLHGKLIAIRRGKKAWHLTRWA